MYVFKTVIVKPFVRKYLPTNWLHDASKGISIFMNERCACDRNYLKFQVPNPETLLILQGVLILKIVTNDSIKIST